MIYIFFTFLFFGFVASYEVNFETDLTSTQALFINNHTSNTSKCNWNKESTGFEIGTNSFSLSYENNTQPFLEKEVNCGYAMVHPKKIVLKSDSFLSFLNAGNTLEFDFKISRELEENEMIYFGAISEDKESFVFAIFYYEEEDGEMEPKVKFEVSYENTYYEEDFELKGRNINLLKENIIKFTWNAGIVTFGFEEELEFDEINEHEFPTNIDLYATVFVNINKDSPVPEESQEIVTVTKIFFYSEGIQQIFNFNEVQLGVLFMGLSFGFVCYVLIICIPFIICFSICGYCFYSRSKKNHEEKQKEDVKATTNDVIENLELQEREKTVANMKINKELFKIDMEDIVVEKKIGSGGFATVFLATYMNMKVAFKTFSTSLLAVSDDGETDSFENFEKELQLISSLNHKFIPRFYGASLKSPRCGLVMEYCPNGDLVEYLKHNKVGIPARIKILHEIAQGMEFLAKKNIIHRDLKPENILISDTFTPKITDFGLSRTNESGNKTVKIGTNLYMAPEIFKGLDYGLSADVFSYGIMIHNVLSNNFNPFGKSQTRSQNRMASDSNFRPSIESIPIEIRKKYPWLIKMMQNNWDEKKENRYTFKRINQIFNSNLNNEKKKEIKNN